MSPSAQTKRWFTLQIIVTILVAGLSACASQPVSKPTNIVVGKSLRYEKTIQRMGIGDNDLIKRILVGNDTLDLRFPSTISVRGDEMLIVDRGEVVDFAGTHLHDKGTAVATGRVRLHDLNANVVFKYNLKTHRAQVIQGISRYITNEMSDIFLDKDGSFYVTDVQGRRVLHFSPGGDLIRTYVNHPNMYRPIAISVDDARNEVLVADEYYSHIVAFDKNTGEALYGIGDRGTGPGKFRIITDMIGIPGGFLVSDRIELRVQVLDRAGNYLANFGRSQLMFPTALAMDKYGRVYVSDKATNTISVYKDGKRTEEIGRNGYAPGEFRLISDMKISNNKLYVADQLNGRIQIFDILPPATGVALAQ